jgi:hypothetical protein
VHTAWVRFPGLLQATDLAPTEEQKVAIKLELDTNPPAGADTRRTIVRRHTLVALQLHDLPSLMAGKIHSILTRPFTKGRDWYDLVWYCSRVPPVRPNSLFLHHALSQTRPDEDSRRWPELLHRAVETADFAAARRDVAPFLEHPEEADWITQEHVRELVDGITSGD